jgi:hypothetical protein
MTRPYSVVEILWEDAHAEPPGPKTHEDIDKIEPCFNTSVGYLMRQTREHVILAGEFSIEPDGTHVFRDLIRVPKGMVRKTTIVAKGKNGTRTRR